MVQAESNTATGLTVVPKVTVHQVKWALQRKLRHLEVPLSVTEIDQEGGLSPSCGPPKVWTAEADQSADRREPNGGGPLVAVDFGAARWSDQRDITRS